MIQDPDYITVKKSITNADKIKDIPIGSVWLLCNAHHCQWARFYIHMYILFSLEVYVSNVFEPILILPIMHLHILWELIDFAQVMNNGSFRQPLRKADLTPTGHQYVEYTGKLWLPISVEFLQSFFNQKKKWNARKNYH